MNFVRVVNPTLEDYAERANNIALRHNCASLLMMTEADIHDENDRNEFAFIMKAVGDQLLHREWEAFASKPSDGMNLASCAEPELISGSALFGGNSFDFIRVCGIS